MKQYAVAHIIASTVDPPDDFVALPPRRPRDLVAANRAESLLAEPETKKLLSPSRVSPHLQVKPTLKVGFPLRIVRVSIPFDLDVYDEGEGRRIKEASESWFPISALTSFPKDILTIEVLKVLLVDPPRRFVIVSSARPVPQAVEDC